MHILIPEFSEFAAMKLKYLPTSQLHIPKTTTTTTLFAIPKRVQK